MKDISKDISSLICLYDCVIIPGFGGFIANPTDAVIDEENGFFTPPSKEIGFNKNLKNNDGLLYHYLTQKYKIAYQEAKILVDEYIEDINIQLKSIKYFIIGDIGELHSTGDGTYQFIPNENINLLAEAFGLNSFHADVPNHINLLPKKEYSIKQYVARATYRKGVAATIGLFIGLFVLTTELKNPGNISKGSIGTAIEWVNKSDIKNNTPPVQQNINISERQAERFHVIIGSFPWKKDALNFAQRYKTKGFDNCDVISVPGKNRVTASSYNTKEEALIALKQIRKIKGFEKAWILKN